MKRTVPEYLHDNVFITTSGVFEHASLVCALSTIGIDNIIFSVDDPFADNAEAVAFLRTAPLSENDREKLAHANAERILKI
jgi:predicted TIM-barrel fold metal-dependent hydrolase